MGNTTKTALFISDCGGDHAKSMGILARKGLRPLTYQEAFSRSLELISELKGKWFYLAGKGIKEDGVYTFTEKGELAIVTGKETLDQKVRVWPGNQPLSLGIGSVGFAGRRFLLLAHGRPSPVAPVVVGVKNGSVAHPHSKIVSSKSNSK